MSDIVIRVENLYKEYKLGVINHGTLTHDLQSWWARVRGKEDPNSLISIHHNPDADRDSFLALKDINIEVKAGERVGIIGKNGAGKSTLLKILSKITSPTKGNVKIKGRVGSLLEVGTGFHPELTGRENIYLNGAILGMSKREIDRKLDEIVDFAGVEKHIDTPVKRYSSGMNVRLGFAVAAHLEPEILIVDEVLAVGDAEFQKKALGKMEDVSKGEGRTILFVSHNMGAVKNLCNNSIWMNNGIIQEYGKTIHIIDKYLHETISGKDNAITTFDIDEKKDFQVESVKLKNIKSDITRDFECDDDIIIEINCISRKPVPGLYGYLHISNQDQSPMIVFDSMEYNPNNPLDNLSIGNHTFQIVIPSRYLGVGTYLLYLNFTSHLNPAGFTVDSPKEICTFNLIDSTTIRGFNRGALLSLVLEWKKIV